MARARRSLAIASTVMVVIAGCSSSESSAPTTPFPTDPPPAGEPADTAPPTTAPPTTAPPTTAPPTTAPSTTAPPPTTAAPTDPLAIDQALARRALLTIDDFPEGWTEQPNEDDDPDPGVQEEFDACLSRGPDSVGARLEDREVESPEFESEAGSLSVEQEVLMADDEAMAIAAMEEVGVEGADACLQDVIQGYFEAEFERDSSDFPPGTTLGRITVERVPSPVDPTVVVEYLLTVPFEVDDEEVSIFLDVVYFRQGRALSLVQFQSAGAPFDPEGVGFLGGEVLDRLAVIGS